MFSHSPCGLLFAFSLSRERMTFRQLALRILGERARGRLGYWLRLDPPDVWNGPFNGQAERTRIFRDILAGLPIQAIIETGTFRGSSTELFASTGLPVYSVEARPRTAAYARARLRKHSTVHLYEGDSRAFLHRLLADPTVPRSDVFFYLDAHWEEDLPLAEEVGIVFQHWPRAVVMVDEFEVPGSSYTFDDYGPGKALSLEYLTPVLLRHGSHAFFPSATAESETGAKRGSVVLCADPDVAATLTTLRSIQAA